MNNQNIIVEKTKALLETGCYDGLKDAANKWLDSLGTAGEKAASKEYVDVLEDSVMAIDTVIELFGNEKFIEKVGKDTAASLLSEAKTKKAAGSVYCPCPACTAGAEVLKYKADLLA